jgi:hypothetical protein
MCGQHESGRSDGEALHEVVPTVGRRTRRLEHARLCTQSPYALNHSVVGASTNSSEPAQASVALAVVTSQELFGDPQLYALDSCLTAWSYVSAERPEIYAAGLEQFIDSGCGAPSVPSPILRIEHQR